MGSGVGLKPVLRIGRIRINTNAFNPLTWTPPHPPLSPTGRGEGEGGRPILKYPWWGTHIEASPPEIRVELVVKIVRAHGKLKFEKKTVKRNRQTIPV